MTRAHIFSAPRLLRGMGQVPLRYALRFSIGQSLHSRAAHLSSLLWGTAFGVMSARWAAPAARPLVFLSCMLIAAAIGYGSMFPWRWRLVRRSTPMYLMIMANGALGLAMGMAIFFVAIAGVNLIIEGTSALNPRAMQGMFWYALYGFQFPLIGFYITLGDDLAHRGTIQRKEKERFERIAEQARLVALRSQINPHFFFNALNTIAALIPRRPADAERAVELLATALRPVVTRDQPMTTDLQTELQVAHAYAAIEELRLGDRCTFNFQVDQPALKCRMPGLSLQPLLENAVRHGAANFPGKYGIRLNASCEANTLHVTIENGPDGELFAEPNRIVQPVKGHALHNIAQRLHILFGPRAVLMVQTGENSSATCRLAVPQDAARPPQ